MLSLTSLSRSAPKTEKNIVIRFSKLAKNSSQNESTNSFSMTSSKYSSNIGGFSNRRNLLDAMGIFGILSIFDESSPC
ncbi:hypothetical protein GIB67_015058, partial [Kingdonia uniflora]